MTTGQPVPARSRHWRSIPAPAGKPSGGDVLILTPAKNASPFLEIYFAALSKLSYPRELISLGFLESDSRDDTYERLRRHAAALSGCYRRAGVWKRDFGFEIPPEDWVLWRRRLPRRTNGAKS